MLLVSQTKGNVQELYTRLIRTRRGNPIETTLARIISSWSLGLGALPAFIGLTEKDFYHMMDYAFPEFEIDELEFPDKTIQVDRFDEISDLRVLLLNNRSGQNHSEIWVVDILIAGCMGGNHLWQDLGFWCRNDLSLMMKHNFLPLFQRNNANMKWKKFLYKQLCEQEGIYTCRSPSCEVCVDYNECFGPE